MLLINKSYKNIYEKKLAILLFVCIIFTVGCAKNEGLWENALYTSDKTFGDGSKTVIVDVVAEDKTVTFTIKTDKDVLGDALLEYELVEGEEGQYGLYIKKVNGILADFDIDGSYWSFTKSGEVLMYGVDGAEIVDGDKYELTYTK